MQELGQKPPRAAPARSNVLYSSINRSASAGRHQKACPTTVATHAGMQAGWAEARVDSSNTCAQALCAPSKGPLTRRGCHAWSCGGTVPPLAQPSWPHVYRLPCRPSGMQKTAVHMGHMAHGMGHACTKHRRMACRPQPCNAPLQLIGPSAGARAGLAPPKSSCKPVTYVDGAHVCCTQLMPRHAMTLTLILRAPTSHLVVGRHRHVAPCCRCNNLHLGQRLDLLRPARRVDGTQALLPLAA